MANFIRIASAVTTDRSQAKILQMVLCSGVAPLEVLQIRLGVVN